MNKKLVTKICTFLLENNVKAQDVYFHWNEIHKELANIEGVRKGIFSKSMEMGSVKQLKAKLYNGQIVMEGDKVSFRNSDGYKCISTINRRDDKTLYFWNSRFNIKDYRNAKKINIFNR